jgi:hypothetical protein
MRMKTTKIDPAALPWPSPARSPGAFLLESTKMRKPPTHDELNRLLEKCEEPLAHAWREHEDDDDILCLGDLNREDSAAAARRFWKRHDYQSPPGIYITGKPGGLLAAYLQPASLIDAMEQNRSFQVKQAAKELRSFNGLREVTGLVPLLVILDDGIWATQWAPPGSNATVIRYDPGPEPDRN